MDQRKTLISSGEHLAAILKLGDSFTAEEYLEAVDLARARGAGELYADRVLGVDIDALTTSHKEGKEIHKAALAELARRGIHDPSYRQLADALAQASR